MSKGVWKTVIRALLVLVLSLLVVNFDKSFSKDFVADKALTQMTNSDSPIYVMDQISTWNQISPFVVGLGFCIGIIWAVQPIRKEMDKCNEV
jgi:hypothetical protein